MRRYKKQMGWIDFYIQGFTRYFDIKGRTSRRGYWSFMIINSAITNGFILFMSQAKAADLVIMYILVMAQMILSIIPGFTITIRRLHDIGRSGLWILAPTIAAAIAGVVVLFYQYQGWPVEPILPLCTIGILGTYSLTFIFTCMLGDQHTNKYGPIP